MACWGCCLLTLPSMCVGLVLPASPGSVGRCCPPAWLGPKMGEDDHSSGSLSSGDHGNSLPCSRSCGILPFLCSVQRQLGKGKWGSRCPCCPSRTLLASCSVREMRFLQELASHLRLIKFTGDSNVCAGYIWLTTQTPSDFL